MKMQINFQNHEYRVLDSKSSGRRQKIQHALLIMNLPHDLSITYTATEVIKYSFPNVPIERLSKLQDSLSALASYHQIKGTPDNIDSNGNIVRGSDGRKSARWNFKNWEKIISDPVWNQAVSLKNQLLFQVDLMQMNLTCNCIPSVFMDIQTLKPFYTFEPLVEKPKLPAESRKKRQKIQFAIGFVAAIFLCILFPFNKTETNHIDVAINDWQSHLQKEVDTTLPLSEYLTYSIEKELSTLPKPPSWATWESNWKSDDPRSIEPPNRHLFLAGFP
ncbi:MAG: hypothetical protein QNK37_06915 [Acidobacteriota bacterium]|nr:hypothetical protein [Acidobacteriota bacterium]